jgi:hypothetical protein
MTDKTIKSVSVSGTREEWLAALEAHPNAADEITALRAQLAEVTEKLEIAHGLIDCACGYDDASDICLGHHKILTKRESAKLAEAEAENANLRDLLRDVLDNGSEALLDITWIDAVKAALTKGAPDDN